MQLMDEMKVSGQRKGGLKFLSGEIRQLKEQKQLEDISISPSTFSVLEEEDGKPFEDSAIVPTAEHTVATSNKTHEHSVRPILTRAKKV